jgi:hypothetical protein
MATSFEAAQSVGNLSPRVSFFVIKAAGAVMSEVNTTPSHAERVAFALRVFESDYDLSSYTSAVLSNPTILAGLDPSEEDLGVSDSDLEFSVNSFYNAFAGVAT